MTRTLSPRSRLARRALLWRFVDAAIPACLAGPTEVLLLFLLSPDRPLTLGDFAAAMLAMLPQVVLLFGLLGPVIVAIAYLLRVGRTTRRGLSTRYVLRFALLDAFLLLAAAAYQWYAVGDLIPGPGRVALAMMITTLAVAMLLLAGMAVFDLRRPRRVGAPWLAAVGVGLAIALTAAAQVRRVHPRPPEPRSLPGFEMSRPLLIVELPALDPRDLDDYLERGLLPQLERIASEGARASVSGGRLSDTIALHANLITGRTVHEHRLIGAVRYKPVGDRRSFAVVPRGLFIRPLLATPLWRRVPVGHDSVSTMALPSIADSLGLDLALIGDPLGWPGGTGDWMVPRRRLDGGRPLPAPAGAGALRCPVPETPPPALFDPPASELEQTDRLAKLVGQALAADRCALFAGLQAVKSETFDVVHVRLPGYYDVAYQFAGWRQASPARSAAEREIEAYGRTLTRYAREIGPGLGELMLAGRRRGLVLLISPHGIRARHEATGLLDAVLGRLAPTGTHAGPPSGVLMIAGEGIRPERSMRRVPLTSVLPTLLWASGLPPSEEMGSIAFELFDEAFTRTTPVVSVPTYARKDSNGGSRR
jgi:hypothetical protein